MIFTHDCNMSNKDHVFQTFQVICTAFAVINGKECPKLAKKYF